MSDPINFPSNPSLNQQFTANNKKFTWNGTSWITTKIFDIGGGGSSGPGTPGATGYTGSLGFTGSVGFVGSRGIDGPRGFTGYTGSIGGTGYTGSAGSIGIIPGQANFCFEGYTALIPVGLSAEIQIPYGSEISSLTILGSQIGTVTFNVRKHTYSQYPNGSIISPSTPPGLSLQRKVYTTDFTGWSTTTVDAGDILTVTILSNLNITRLNIFLGLTRL